MDISVPHLVGTVWGFVDEEERAAGKGSTTQRRTPSDASLTKERHPESAAAEEAKQKVTYQISERPSARVQEEEFAKQLRLARYLAASSLPPSRTLEPAREVKTPKRGRPVVKARPKATGKKPREEELAKERRRAGRVGHKAPSAGPGRGEKQRGSPGR